VDDGDLGWTSVDPPQTVLKTAGLPSAKVHHDPPEFGPDDRDSASVHKRPSASADLAVILAVVHRSDGCD
jgi:hypothetical protein